MKEIKVKNMEQMYNVLCILLGEYVIKESKVTRHNNGNIDFKNGTSISHVLKLEDFNETYIVDFFIYDEGNAEVVVYAFGQQYIISVKKFPKHGFLNMDILNCIFNVLTEKDIREAVGFILSAVENNNEKENVLKYML